MNLETGETAKGKLNIDEAKIADCGKWLGEILLDYMRDGGDMHNITPEAVFGKRQTQRTIYRRDNE